MTYALLADVVEVFRPLPTQEEQLRAVRLLNFAGAILRREVPGLVARLAAGTLDPELVRGVETAMVVRVLQNPEGRRQGSESVGPFTQSWTVDAALASGALYLTDEERRLLQPVAAPLSSVYVVPLGGH